MPIDIISQHSQVPLQAQGNTTQEFFCSEYQTFPTCLPQLRRCPTIHMEHRIFQHREGSRNEPGQLLRKDRENRELPTIENIINHERENLS